MNRNNTPSTSRGGGDGADGAATGVIRGRGGRGYNKYNPYNRWRGGGGGSGSRTKVTSISIPNENHAPNNEDDDSTLLTSSICPPINPEPLISLMLDDNNTKTKKFSGWQLYFPKETQKDGSSLDIKIKTIESYIKRNSNDFNFEQIHRTLCYTLHVQNWIDDNEFHAKWSTFNQDLIESPEQTLACAGLAMHNRMCKYLSDTKKQTTLLTQVSSLPSSTAASLANQENDWTDFKINRNLYLQIIRVRVEGCVPLVNLRSLKVSSYGRLVTVRGTIIRASAAQLMCTWMAFKCSKCGNQQACRQPDGIMTMPSNCKDGCRAGRTQFQPQLLSSFTKTEAYQQIRLQESMQSDQFTDSGRVPRSIEVEFCHDLVDSVYPGDDVTITGILKVHPVQQQQADGGGNFRQQKQQQQQQQRSSNTATPNMYTMYLEAITVISNKNVMASRKSEFTEIDLQAISMIKSEQCPFRLLVHSLCPSIFGHEMVKAGLILGLLGGSSNYSGHTDSNDHDIDNEQNSHGKKNRKRCEAHILVVGDPGVGKSQMLQACANVSPRGVFVCGNSSSNAGLTASVRHDKNSSGGSLEAGALVLADQGTCCIDEFDKMSSNHQALLEVMEQQTVSIAKAGVLCSLPARTCILAAANPSGGHYDKSKSVSENLRLNPALLSRFDLVFILLDRPDVHLDSLLTAHIQSLHRSTTNGGTGGSSSNGRFSSISSYISDHQRKNESNCRRNESNDDDSNRLLYEHLLVSSSSEPIDPLPHGLMQKFIAYARKNCHPLLSSEASEEIKKFYLDLRCVQPGIDTIPVTTRQLEALIRLTQARARADLAPTASRRHAMDVLEIVRYSMVDVLSTDKGTLQMSRNVNGAGMSQATQVKKFLKVLQQQSNYSNKTIFTTDELKDTAMTAGIPSNFGQLIDALNIQGFILKKGINLYKLLVD